MSRDRGSLSIEYVIITPLVFLVFGLIWAFGRVSSVDNSLDAGTRDAARAASLAADKAQAQAVAEQAVQAGIGNDTSTCLSTLRVDVSGAFTAGSTITVKSTCSYDLSDVLSLGALPGQVNVTAQFSVVIDPNRSLG